MNSDIWSLGLLVFECAIGHFPFFDKVNIMNILDFYKFILKNSFMEFPSSFSENLRDFLTHCLHIEPEKRSKAY